MNSHETRYIKLSFLFLKCAKTHLGASAIPIILPGVIPQILVKGEGNVFEREGERNSWRGNGDKGGIRGRKE